MLESLLKGRLSRLAGFDPGAQGAQVAIWGDESVPKEAQVALWGDESTPKGVQRGPSGSLG